MNAPSLDELVENYNQKSRVWLKEPSPSECRKYSDQGKTWLYDKAMVTEPLIKPAHHITNWMKVNIRKHLNSIIFMLSDQINAW